MIYEQVVYSLEWSKGAVSSLILTCLMVLTAIAMVTNHLTCWTERRDA